MSAVSVAVWAGLSGCKPPPEECITGDEAACDLDGGVPSDVCNSADEAVASDGCKLTVGDGCPAAKMGASAVIKEGYISTLADGGRDTDFYSAQLPDGLTPRCLLHVSAGYSVPQTAVNLSVNVLNADGTRSIAAGIDRHNAAAPKFVDLIVPYGESKSTLLVQLADEAATVQTKVDNRNPYSLKVEVLENPDPNEPNDSTATVIPLTADSEGVAGASFGYLATTNDIDTYSFEVTAAGRQIIYLHIGSPVSDGGVAAAPPFKLSYALLAPDGTQLSEGLMENEFLQIDLKTARLAQAVGTYKVVVKGYKMEGQTAPVLGDLRLRYDVEVRVLPDKDLREPNDSLETAQTVNLAPGSTTLNGRIAYVADEEWFKLVVPASATARTLRYEITVAPGGGRFAALSPIPTRQAQLLTLVTAGVTPQDRKTNCINDPAVCPRSFNDSNSSSGQLVTALCGIADPPRCLWADRNEEAQIMGLQDMKNFVGALPVPTGGQTYFLMFRNPVSRASQYADDREWSIHLELATDSDAQSRAAGPMVVNLGPSFVDAPGVISYGHGELLNFDPNAGRGIRGPRDYDAYETDRDLFQFNYPGGATGDQSWGLEWVINNNSDAGVAPADLALEVTLCGSAAPVDGGLCGAARRFIFAASLNAVTPWYLPVTNGSQRVLFTKSVQGATTTLTATPAGCNCFAGSKVAAGKFFVNVAGVNRVSNAPIEYRVRQSVNPYPNGNPVCPVTDGGCRFAGQ